MRFFKERDEMRIRIVLGLILIFPMAALAGDMLNAKEGLWEMTVTTGGSGMPTDQLAKLPPDQRAMVEQMMKQKGMSMNGNTMTIKSCVTKDKISKGAAFSDSRSSSNNDCTRTVVKSSANHMEAKFHCETKNGTTDGNSVIDIVGDSVKGTTHFSHTDNGNTKTFDSTFTSKYLGADCGDVK
jgi:hypothetical protein